MKDETKIESTDETSVKEDEIMEEMVDYIASLNDEDAEEFLDINENCM